MKYGEMKIEALKLMFANLQDDLTVDGLPIYYQDENYRDYLINMPGAINRCFSYLEAKRALPSISRTLNLTDGDKRGAFIRFNLPLIIKDFFDIERLVKESENGEYDGEHPYRREGDVLVLDTFEKDDGVSYTVVYTPKLKRVGIHTPENEEIPIPESLAAHIPYYIKGDLFRIDEPNEASEARNWFESAVSELIDKKVNSVSGVKTVYSQTEW